MEHYDEESLTELQKHLESRLTKDDFIKSFEQVINLVLKVQKDQSEAITKLETTYGALMEKMRGDNSMSLSEMKAMMGNHFTEYTQRHTDTISQKMAEVKDGKNADEEIMIKTITSQLKDKVSSVLDTPEQIRNKLEMLDGNERLKMEAIKDLKEKLEEMEKKIPKNVYVGGSAGGGRIVKSYDISSSLNGVLKTFSLPAFWRVISVHLSSFPNILRETTDYTTSASAMTITFTSEIDAGTSLATGQTLVVIYSEA